MNRSTEKEISFSQGQIIWSYVFLSALFLLIFLNNGLILTAIMTQRRLQSQINVISLGSLSLAQFLGGLLLIPIHLSLLEDYQSSERLKFARGVTTFLGVVSQLHLTVMCVDRCFASVYSTAYGSLKRGTVAITVLIAWFLAIFASVLSIVDFKNFSVFLVTAFYIVPLVIDVFGYCLVYRTMSSVATDNRTTLLRKELRLAKSIALMTLVFTLLWVPFIIAILLRDYCTSCNLTSSVVLFVLYCQSLSLIFSSLVYCRGSLDFRLAFKIVARELGSFLRRKRDRHHDIPPGSSPSPRISRVTTPSNRNEVVNQVNLAMFMEREQEEIMRMTASLSHSQGGVKNAPLEKKEEVHIVPFDQARFLGQTASMKEFQSELCANEVSSLGEMNLEDDSKKNLQPLVAFHDIEIVPYEQSC